MDVSNIADLDGQALIEKLISLTGLPSPLVHREMKHIFELTGQEATDLTLDELRQAMLVYLESVQQYYLSDSQGTSP